MTLPQRNKLMIELWPAACRAQGWKASDRNFRLFILSVAVSFEIGTLQQFFQVMSTPVDKLPRLLTTADEIDQGEEFTKVKAVLSLLSDSVAGARDAGDPALNLARQKRNVILSLMQCLSIYPLEKPMGVDGAEAYVTEIISGKFKRAMAIEELSYKPVRFTDRGTGEPRQIPSQLDQLLYTLSARVSKYRQAAKHSEHQMRQIAGVRCRKTCQECR
jgi:hypothetical protein